MLRLDCDPISIGLNADGHMVVEPYAGVEVTARQFQADKSKERYRIKLEKSERTWRYETPSHLDAQRKFRLALKKTEEFREAAELVE